VESDRPATMAQQQTRGEIARAPIGRTRAVQDGGSIGLVLLIAVVLVGAGVGLLLLGRTQAEPYILALLSVLAMIGVFLLFALAVGLLRVPSKDVASPLIKRLVESAGEGILVTDGAGRVLYANPAYLRLVDANNADDVRPVERGEAGRWLRMRVAPLGEGAREQALTVWSIADVTRELERQENVFQELQHAVDYLDHAPAGFFSVDAAGNISYLNATLADWLDQDLAEVGSGGLRLRDVIAGEGASLVTTLSAAPGEVKTELFDIDLKTKSGRHVPARLYHKVAFGADGTAGASRTLVINRAGDGGSDPLRAAEVRFMRFFQNTPMAIATVDKQGTIVRTNALFARLFNPVLAAPSSAHSPSQTGVNALLPGEGKGAGGRTILAVVAERERSALSAAIKRAADKQGEIDPVDAAVEGKGERSARFYVTAVEEQDQEAAIVYAIETTAQKDLENKFTQAQKMELVGQLAGGIAHDFNNVLGAIMMASDFLVNAHKPTDPSFQDIIQIRQNANRAAAMVRHLLAFSRKQTLRPQVLDLGEVVYDLTMLMRRLIGERITLNVVPQRDLWPVKADLAQFEQVLVNLVVNARDAMAEGGKLTLRTANVGADTSAKLQYKGMPIGEYVLVEVEDTGTGIPSEIIDKIFDPFFTTKDVGKGTGLGLSTVYGIIKQTGGFVYVESTIGIFIPRYIPAADDVQPPQLPETTAPALAGALSAADDAMKTAADLTGQGTILLVEDEEGLRALNARGLSSRGYTVIEAGNGVEAMEMLERQGGKVDLVVSDVVMPEMDGPTLLKELRKKNPETKIIFVSGYAEDAFQKSLPDPDDYNFLAKPFTLKQLVAKVKETMAEV
jgi:two-component system cell cycle sensor histidine kinase/response regulator CckA